LFCEKQKLLWRGFTYVKRFFPRGLGVKPLNFGFNACTLSIGGSFEFAIEGISIRKPVSGFKRVVFMMLTY